MFAVPGSIDIGKLIREIDFDTTFTYITNEGQEVGEFAHIERNKELYLQNHLDKYYYVIHKIMEGRVFNKDLDALDYVSLKYEYLENMLGRRYVGEILRLLRKLKVIQRDSFYIKGEKSYGYRINPAYNGRIVLRDVYKTEIWDNKLAKQKATYKAKNSKANSNEWKNLTQLKIREKEAKAFIEQKSKDTYSLISTYKSLLEQFSSIDFKKFKSAFNTAKASANKCEQSFSFIHNNITYHYDKVITLSNINANPNNNESCIHYNISYSTKSPFLTNTIISNFILHNDSISASSLYWNRMYNILFSIKGNYSLYNSTYFLMNVQEIKKSLQLEGNKGLTAYQLLSNCIINQYNTDLISISKIVNEDWFIEQPDSSSRIYTNLSNLSTDLRNFLYHKKHNQILINLDIRNSQPYIFSLLLTEKYRGKELPYDVKQYIELTASGKFYEHVMSLLGMSKEEIADNIKRKEFKIEFFGKIFFCNTHYSIRTREGKIFAKNFANVYALINEYKEEAYQKLAIEMQHNEAKVILGEVGTKLKTKKIWFNTIHDSVVVLAEHAEQVKEIVLASFRKSIGIAPTIHDDKLIFKNTASNIY
jgi:hypothetical protein